MWRKGPSGPRGTLSTVLLVAACYAHRTGPGALFGKAFWLRGTESQQGKVEGAPGEECRALRLSPRGEIGCWPRWPGLTWRASLRGGRQGRQPVHPQHLQAYRGTHVFTRAGAGEGGAPREVCQGSPETRTSRCHVSGPGASVCPSCVRAEVGMRKPESPLTAPQHLLPGEKCFQKRTGHRPGQHPSWPLATPFNSRLVLSLADHA